MRFQFLFLVLFGFMLVLPTVDAVVCDYNITTAGFLINANDTVYCLNSTLESTATNAIYFDNNVQNTTLDCQGHLINDIGNSENGVLISGELVITNNTVKNCYVTGFGNGINVGGSSSNNYFENNTLTDNNLGFYLRGVNNIVSGGSISGNFNSDYQNYASTGGFINTNFTGQRTIYFADPGYWFNYKNDTALDIWLNTTTDNSSIITRTLINWNNTLMQWNDSSSNIVVATYNLSGMLANTRYFVNATNSYLFNNTGLSRVVWSDSNGDFSFDLELIAGLEHEIKVVKNMPTLSPVTCDYNITSLPYTINQNSKTYCMDQSLSIDGQTAITFASGTLGSTLDCRGYVLKGNESDSTAGVLISPTAQQNTIRNCVIDKFALGMFLNYTNLNTLFSNTLISYTGNILLWVDKGNILVYYSNSTTINNNHIGYSTNGYAEGINVYYSNNNTITGNYLATGIEGDDAIALDYSNNNTVKNNDIYWSGDSCIEGNFNDSIIEDNRLYYANSDCIDIDSNSVGNTIKYNTIWGPKYGGITVGYKSKNNIVENNEIAFSDNYGITIGYLTESNIIKNNNLHNNKYGYYINQPKQYNIISGGTNKDNTQYDYYYTNSQTDVVDIRNTGFTSMKKIYFQDATSWFSYNNQTTGNIWLKTSSSAVIAINRTLIKWSGMSMNWTDVASGAVTMTYIFTGLVPSTNYDISVNGIFEEPYTTDANGNLTYGRVWSGSGSKTFGVVAQGTYFPSDVNFSVDGNQIYTGSGDLTTSVPVGSFVSEINTYLSSCTESVPGYCDVPLTFETADAGNLLADGLSITYGAGGGGMSAMVSNVGLSDTELNTIWATDNDGSTCVFTPPYTELEVGDFFTISNSTCGITCDNFLSVRATTTCGTGDEFIGTPVGC